MSILKKCQSLLLKATKLPKSVRIVEVGPRDGLQNESSILTAEFKSNMVSSLLNCGIKHIETGAFVSPKWVPQMANSDSVLEMVRNKEVPHGVILSSLVPNVKGMERGKFNIYLGISHKTKFSIFIRKIFVF